MSAPKTQSGLRGLAEGVPLNEAGVPQVTQALYDGEYADRHTLHGLVAKWARERPDAVAIIDHEGARELTWSAFEHMTASWARQLLELGLGRGDIVVTQLPLLVEHLALEYACFRIGAVAAPLDIRLKAPEVVRSVQTLGDRVRAFAFLGKVDLPAGTVDFSPVGAAVAAAAPPGLVLLQATAPHEAAPGALTLHELAERARSLREAEGDEALAARVRAAEEAVDEADGCLVIFTSGSTGLPKGALLSHRGITAQACCMAHGLEVSSDSRMLVNLPPSHVGCQTEQVGATLFAGGSMVTLPVFHPAHSLEAVQRWKCTHLGQIPALFAMQWRLPNYDEYDLGSLRLAIAAGQAMTRPFLERVLTMAPALGSGLGLTEASGFTTYTSLRAPVEVLSSGGVGYWMPLYRVTIREPMLESGAAGPEVAAGATGEVCYEGPQTLVGYVGNEEAYRKTVSTDGVLYSGDLGYVRADDGQLTLRGRKKFTLKPKGFQIFPPQVENWVAEVAGVKSVAVVGVPHEVFSDGVVALVETDGSVQEGAIRAHLKEVAPAYARPLHYVMLGTGGIPLNRMGKTDYLASQSVAAAEVEKLKAAGGWDRQ